MAVLQAASDAELIARVRGGDLEAYAQLYGRHVDAARTLARRCTRSAADADDLVAQAFEAVLGALQRGNGPDEAFRAYLFTTIRRSAARQQGSRVEPTDEGDLDSVEPFIDPAIAGLERSLVAQAFLSLPERWQAVLWHTEIEGASAAEVAELLGLRPNAAAALAYRAREGLRQAYLRFHVADVGSEHQATVDKLGAYARDALSPLDKAKVEAHLDECERCKAAYLEMTDVNAALVRSVAPLFLGAGAAGYLSAIGKAGFVGGGIVLRFLRKLRNPAVAGSVAAGAVVVAGAAFGLTQLAGDDKPPAEVATSEPSAPSNRQTPPPPPVTPPTTQPPTTEPLQVPGEELPIVVVTTTTRPPATTMTTTSTTTTSTTTTTTTTTTLPPSDLSISGSVEVLPLPITIFVAATNAGPIEVTGAQVVVTIEGATFIGGSNNWVCVRTEKQSTCTLPALAPGATSTEQLDVMLDRGSSQWRVEATITHAASIDPNPTNNRWCQSFDPPVPPGPC